MGDFTLTKRKALSLFESWANGKGVLLFAALELAFNFFILPAMAPKTGLAAQAPLFDVKLWYTPQELGRALMLFTPAQRRAAAIGHLTLDVLYPLVYGTLFSLLLILLHRPFSTAGRYRRLLALPWLAVLADYGENLLLAALFLAYPARLPALERLAPLFTALKWALVSLTLLAVTWGLLRVLLSRPVQGRSAVKGWHKVAAGLGLALLLLPVLALAWAYLAEVHTLLLLPKEDGR